MQVEPAASSRVRGGWNAATGVERVAWGRAQSVVRMSRGVAAALALGVSLILLNNAVIQPWTLDDAYISMRYADHLAAGAGPVYNLGERVEGYTCFLWVVLLALGSSLGAETEAWAKVLGLGLPRGAGALLWGWCSDAWMEL